MKIKTTGNGDIHLGNGSEFICEGISISNLVTRATINIGIGEVVTAKTDIMLTELDIDGAVLKINKIESVPSELVNALREYFKNEITKDTDI